MDVRRISELQCLATRSNGTMSAMSAVSHAWQKVLQGWEVQVAAVDGAVWVDWLFRGSVHNIQQQKK
jgi:hypothetical protein